MALGLAGDPAVQACHLVSNGGDAKPVGESLGGPRRKGRERQEGRIGRVVTMISGTSRRIAPTTARPTLSGVMVPKIAGAATPLASCRAKMPSPVTNPGITAEKPIPVPVY